VSRHTTHAMLSSPTPSLLSASDLLAFETDRATTYVFGIAEENAFPVLVVVAPTADGWRTRATHLRYSHDYICYESFAEVMEWIDNDLQRSFIALDRNEALQTLTANHDGSEHRLGRLCPGGVRSGSLEEADIVLRHLERGW